MRPLTVMQRTLATVVFLCVIIQFVSFLPPNANAQLNDLSGTPRIQLGGELPYVPVDVPSVKKLMDYTTDPEGRAAMYVLTDKQNYRPGETVWWHSFVLGPFTKRLLLQDQWSQWRVEVKNSRGEVIETQGTRQYTSAGAGKWTVPTSLPGGEYSLHIIESLDRFEGVRNFTVMSYRTPRLRLQLEFLNKGYGPGDLVEAELKASRAEGGTPREAEVRFEAVVDGETVASVVDKINADGVARGQFHLPKTMVKGEGTLTAIVYDGGVTEAKSKTIPIALQSVAVDFYPAGGFLVSGVVNSLFFESSTPWGEPLDIVGEICSVKEVPTDPLAHCQNGRGVAAHHEGRGVVDFTPEVATDYVLRFFKPAGVAPVALPPVSDFGAIITFDHDVDSHSQPGSGSVFAFSEDLHVNVAVRSPKHVNLQLQLRHLEKEVGSVSIRSPPSHAVSSVTKWSGSFTPPSSAVGVLSLTLLTEDGNPIAERLVFRHPRKTLSFTVKPDREIYGPGDTVSLVVTAKDTASNTPVPDAYLSVFVTDDAALEMVETRRRSPNLVTAAYIEGEVSHLESAATYMHDRPKLSLLLGTQGWRMFMYASPKAFLEKYKGKAATVLQVAEWVFDQAAFGGGEEVMMMKEMALGGGRGAPVMAAMNMQLRGGAPPMAKAMVMMDMGMDFAAAGVLAEPPADEVVDVVEENEEGGGGQDGDVLDVGPVLDFGGVLDAGVDADMAQRLAPPMMMIMADEPWRPESARVLVTYAHQSQRLATMDSRSDFTETIYSGNNLRTDVDGSVRLIFDVSHSVTSFRVSVNGVASHVDGSGWLGSSNGATFEVRKPFYIETKLPTQVTSGDIIRMPVLAMNMVKDVLTGQIHVESTSALVSVGEPSTFTMTIQGEDSEVSHVPLTIGRGSVSSLAIIADGSVHEAHSPTVTYHDRVRRTVSVAPKGFPIFVESGGLIEADAKGAPLELILPTSYFPGSVTHEIKLYPSPVANLEEALKALIQEPCGCFEQTSATSYPLVMALKYFQTHTGVDPTLVEKSTDILKRAYVRLAKFETSTNGFDWFGEAPGHEALSAYGLLQFLEMKEVISGVDDKLIERTKEWLLSRKADPSTGWLLNPRALDSFGGAPTDVTNAYILWSLTAAGMSGLDDHVRALEESLTESSDTYLVALVAGSLYNIKETQRARRLANFLTVAQEESGTVVRATTSITRSRGESLLIETTAMSALVWMNEYAVFAPQVQLALEALCSKISNGAFGSTQGTVLALKAIIQYDSLNAAGNSPAGSVRVFVDDKFVTEVSFEKGTTGAILVQDPAIVAALMEGAGVARRLHLELSGGKKMPYSVRIGYSAELPSSVPAAVAGVTLETTLSSSTTAVGSVELIKVTVGNGHEDSVPTGMVVARIGLPGGLDVRMEKLAELKKSGEIDFYEVQGREVHLYWRSLAAKEVKVVNLDVVAGVPGTYTGPASSAYEYYPQQKVWAAPLVVSIGS